jgi:hypothetical protein
LFSRNDTLTYILDILERKIASYEDFNQNFPGFGGFLPWFTSTDVGMAPISPGWSNNVPALDNGQLLWSMYAAIPQILVCCFFLLSYLFVFDMVFCFCVLFHIFIVC